MSAVKWILVANNSGARVFKTIGRSPDLGCIHELQHDTHLHGHGAVDEKSGRHNNNHDVSSKRHEEERFAHDLVAYLEKGHSSGHFSELILVAPPRFLGELRNGLSSVLKKCVVETLDKDFPSKLSVKEVVTHLQKDLFALQAVGA